jgi:hypothetical protein
MHYHLLIDDRDDEHRLIVANRETALSVVETLARIQAQSLNLPFLTCRVLECYVPETCVEAAVAGIEQSCHVG